MVVIPPTRGYEWVVPIAGTPIPQAPEWLIREIFRARDRDDNGDIRQKVIPYGKAIEPCLIADELPLHRTAGSNRHVIAERLRKKDWFRLRRICPRFDGYWHRIAINVKDTSDSGWESIIAK